MAQDFSERNIDLNCEFVVPKFVSIALAKISAIDDLSQKLLKLYSLLQALEEEAKKIYIIRREGGVDESIQLFVPYKTMTAKEEAALKNRCFTRSRFVPVSTVAGG
nr:myb family transcription factor EFM-like [Ipomoea batatas]